jgi:hypothetical protein
MASMTTVESFLSLRRRRQDVLRHGAVSTQLTSVESPTAGLECSHDAIADGGGNSNRLLAGKSGRALRASGIARFAVAGPVGIVRSGSVVALRPSARRVVRPAAEGASSRVA